MFRVSPSSMKVLGVVAAAVPVLFAPMIAAAQEATAPAPESDSIGILMMFTLGAALAIGVLLLVSFLRKRSNRDAMRRLNNE